MASLIKAPIEPEIVEPETLWVVDHDKTQDHWLQLRDPEGLWECYVKWDGCCEIWVNQADGTQGEQQHICDLENYIKRLQSIVDEAHKHFGKDNWPG